MDAGSPLLSSSKGATIHATHFYSAAWSEEQNQGLKFLFQKLQEANSRLMLQVQDIPGYTDLTPRQQSRLYSELVGQGVVSNLLHLTRQGRLDIDLMRKILHDPERLSQVIDIAKEFSKDAPTPLDLDVSS